MSDNYEHRTKNTELCLDRLIDRGPLMPQLFHDGATFDLLTVRTGD